MLGRRLRSGLLATAAAATLILVADVGAANASVVINAWRFNLSDAATGAYAGTGLTDATNIDHMELTGNATIQQNVVGGVALGQSFVENGFLQVSGFKTEPGSGALINFSLGTLAKTVYITFNNLTGVLHNDGSISFNPGVGTIKLWLDSDSDLDPTTGTVAELAAYEIASPSGGSKKDFFGGTADNSTIDVTLNQLSGIPGLFSDSSNNPLSLLTTLHLGNVNALLDPNFNPNPDNSGIDGSGNGPSVIHVQNAGQYNVAVPEPATLSILGLGLLVMGASVRRKNAANA